MMPKFRVKLLDPATARIAEVVVEADSRGKAITQASRATGLHRDLVVEAMSLNPASGGGAKRG